MNEALNGPGLVFYNAVLCCAQWAQRVIQKRRVTFVQVNLHYSLLFERVATLGSRIMSSHIKRLESQFFFVQRFKYFLQDLATLSDALDFDNKIGKNLEIVTGFELSLAKIFVKFAKLFSYCN